MTSIPITFSILEFPRYEDSSETGKINPQVIPRFLSTNPGASMICCEDKDGNNIWFIAGSNEYLHLITDIIHSIPWKELANTTPLWTNHGLLLIDLEWYSRTPKNMKEFTTRDYGYIGPLKAYVMGPGMDGLHIPPIKEYKVKI